MTYGQTKEIGSTEDTYTESKAQGPGRLLLIATASCSFCGKDFNPDYKGKKFCTRLCYGKSKVGKKSSAGPKISAALKGKPKSQEHIRKVADALRGQKRLDISNENHPGWKGDAVGYCALHDWVRRKLSTAHSCTHCGVNNRKIKHKNGNLSSYLHLCNISGEYKRNILDWKYLCPPCHSQIDKGRNSMQEVFAGYLRK